MKSLLLSAALVLSANAFAAGPSFNSAKINELPVFNEAVVVSQGGGGLAAVQPTGHVVFKYEGCSPRQFEALLKDDGGVTLIKVIKLPMTGKECKAIRELEGSVQISSDMDSWGKYVILNPVRPIVK